MAKARRQGGGGHIVRVVSDTVIGTGLGVSEPRLSQRRQDLNGE